MICFWTFFIELCILAISRPAIFVPRSDSLQLILIAGFSISYLALVVSKRKYRELCLPLVLGFAFRVFLLFWDLYYSDIYTLPNSGGDSEVYFSRAIRFASGVQATEKNFYLVAGLLFKLIGNARPYGQFVNVLCSLVAIHIFIRVLDLIGIAGEPRKFTTWVICLLPNFAILSAIFLREALIIMLVSLSFLYFVRWLYNSGLYNLILAFLLVLCASYFHGGTVAVAGGYAVVVAFYSRKTRSLRFNSKTVFLVCFFFLVFAFLYVQYGDVLFSKIAGIDSVSDVAGYDLRGGSSYASYVGTSDNIFSMILYTPLRMVYFLFSPMPWMWRGVSDLIAFFCSSLFYLVTIWQIVCTLVRYPDSRKGMVMVCALVLMATVFVFGWGVSNAGTAARHRDKIVVIATVALATCFNARGSWRLEILKRRIRL